MASLISLTVGFSPSCCNNTLKNDTRIVFDKADREFHTENVSFCEGFFNSKKIEKENKDTIEIFIATLTDKYYLSLSQCSDFRWELKDKELTHEKFLEIIRRCQHFNMRQESCAEAFELDVSSFGSTEAFENGVNSKSLPDKVLKKTPENPFRILSPLS